MKVKLKKNVEIPAEIKTFTERVLSTPLENLHEVLDEFSWRYEKGDFHHWIPIINYFDSFLEKYIRRRADLAFKLHPAEADPVFPTQTTLAVLRVTTKILENCTNKHLYQSYEYLTDLLAAPSSEVLISTLQALMAFLRKTHHSSVRFHGYPALNTRLFDLCRGWGGTEQGLEMTACVREDETSIQDYIKHATTLHFEFYSDKQTNTEQTTGLKVIHEEQLNQHSFHLTEHQILDKLVKQHAVPISLRFRLLNGIRIARGFESLEGRRSLVKIRLLAFCVLFQSNPLHDDMLSFFLSEPEFMNELVGLVQAESSVSLELRTLALKALTVQLVDRSRHTAVVNAIGVGGQNGVLSILLQDSIDYLCSQETTSSSSHKKAKYNSQFVDALLFLVSSLISSSAGSVALSESGFIPALLPLIKDRNSAHTNLVCTAVKILEGFMAFSSTASALLRGLGGLSAMIDRLKAEVQLGTGQEETASSSSSQQGAKKRKSPEEETKQVPYLRRLLLKSLLRAIALASYAPTVGNGARPEDQDARTLYHCLKAIFLRAKEFGGALFAFAASVATDLIHHDPFCFQVLDEAGVPDAFLDAILDDGVIPSSEAVCCIPATLVAFCLNDNGLQKVKDRHALSCLTVIFTSKKYLRALSGDTASILGAGMDELFRHVPSLKEEGIQHVVVHTLKSLCLLGGDPQLLQEYKLTPSTSKNPTEEQGEDVEMSDTPAVPSTQPEDEEMEVVEEQQEVESRPLSEIPSEVLERARELGIDSTLPECVSHGAKMLESLLSNSDTSRKFVQNHGVEWLLRLYKLPKMPPAFGSSSQSHSLLSIFRSLSHDYYQCLSVNVPISLSSQLEATTIEAEKLGCVCVPCLEAEQRDGYVRLIASTSGLTAVAGTIARTSNPMLTEICKGDKNLISLLGHLERLVLLQLSHSDLWKEKKIRLRKEAEAQNEISNTTGGILGAGGGPSSGAGNEMSGGGAVVEESEAERTDIEMTTMDVDAEFVSSGDTSHPTWNQEIEMQNLNAGKYSRRKSPDDLAFDVLQHFVVTVRGLYTSIAKSIHTPARRRDESFAQPSLTMKAAALSLALILKNNLEFEINDLEDGGVYRYIKHQGRLVEEVHMVLFDSRRQCCHTLILNYFVAVKGMTSVLKNFSRIVELLWKIIVETKNQPCSSTSQLADGESNVLSQNETKQAIEVLLLAFLKLFSQLTSPRLLCQSAPTASLLVVPLPSKEETEEQEQPQHQEEETSGKSKEFIKSLQESILEAVLPIWSSLHLDKASPEITSRVIGILNSCLDGGANLSAALRAIGSDGSTGGSQWRQPDASMVQQIIDMGFTRPRAIQALRRIGQNSVELALEWLVNHPEEESQQQQQQRTENAPQNDELAASMAASLHQLDGNEEQSMMAGSSSQHPSESLQCADLVVGAVSVLERKPIAAFSISSLMMTLCNRNDGADRKSVVHWLVNHLSNTIVLIQQDHEKCKARMNATAHLLALMMADSIPCRKILIELNLANDLLKVLEIWEKNYNGNTEIPVFVEGILLILDFLAQTHLPPPPPPSTTQTPPTQGQDSAERTTTTTTGEEQTGAESTGQSSETTKQPESEIERLQKIMEVWTPSGSITEPQRFFLVDFCVKLLKHLHQYGKEWTPPVGENGSAIDQTLQSDPAGVTQAIVQILASISRCHQTASNFLHQEGVDLLLTLPAACILPRHESYISTILMHILEDESTLLFLMESEIKHVFAAQKHPVDQLPVFEWEQMRMGNFLQKMSSLAYRSPKVFLKAVNGLCTIGPRENVSGNQSIYLKKTKQQMKASHGSSVDKTGSGSQDHKNKSNKRVVLMSFVEVIDKLLEHIMSFDLTANSMLTEKDQDLESVRPRLPPTGLDSNPSTNTASNQLARMNGHENWDATDRLLESVQRSIQTENTSREGGRPGGENPIVGSSYSRQMIMNNRDLIIQVMVLRMLSEFCLMYSSTIGVLLKRDAELSQRDPPVITEMHSSLLKRVLHGHLSWSLKSDLLKPNLSEEASRFLQAVCIRSSEGRRRVLTETVAVLNWATGLCPKATKQSHVDMPFVSVIGAPSGTKIKALISLVGSLLTTGNPSKPSSQSSGGNQTPTPTTGLTVELIRSMRSVGMVSALTKALELVDIHHPEAPKAINSIIKPLEILTRLIPLAPKKNGGHGSSGIGSGGNATGSSSGVHLTPERERSEEARDVNTMMVSTSPPSQTRHIQPTGLIPADLHELQDAAQLLYHALENINEMEEGSLEDAIQSNEDDPMDASEDEEDGDSDSGSSESSSDSGSFHEDGSQEEHVVVDEESEEIEDEHEELDASGEEELEEDDDDDDMEDGEDDDDEEDEDDDDGSADMELEDGEDWEDNEITREYAETLDHIESVVWGAEDPPEILNTLRNDTGIIFSRNERGGGGGNGMPPHIRSVLENMLGNFVGTRDDSRQDRRGGIRFRLLPRDQGTNTHSTPPYRVQPVGVSEHRLLARPASEGSGNQNGSSSRNMTEAFGRRFGQVVRSGGNWRRHLGYQSLLPELLRGSQGELGINHGLYFFTGDGMNSGQHQGGSNEVANAFGERRNRDNSQQGGPDIGTSWMNSMQTRFEDFLLNSLSREQPESLLPVNEASSVPPSSTSQRQQQTTTPVAEETQQQTQPTAQQEEEMVEDEEAGEPMDEDQAPVILPATSIPVQQQQQDNNQIQEEQEQDNDQILVEQEQDADRIQVEEEQIPEQILAEQNQDNAQILTEQDHDRIQTEQGNDQVVSEQEQDDEQVLTEQEQDDDQIEVEQGQNQTGSQGQQQEVEGQTEEAEESLPAEILECAEQAGIDPAFLQALPRPLQIEILSEHGVSVSQLVASNQQQTQQDNEEGQGTGVDPEFLAALPPDIREEVLESQRLEERRREVERRLTEGHGDEVANVIASLPDDIREEVLLYGGPDILYNLPPNLLAEGQRMRERSVRHQQRDNEDEQLSPNLFFRRLRQEGGVNRGGGAGVAGTSRLHGKKDKKEEMEIPPSVDLHGLTSLVNLLQINQPVIKGHLQRLFLNLCIREDSRREITQLLLQRLKESEDQSRSGTSPSVTRRMLDLLSYLARYPSSKVAEMMLELQVKTTANEKEKHGKLPINHASLNPKALAVLIDMLSQPLCLRSVSTLEQGLLLLEAILQCATNKKKELENEEEQDKGPSTSKSETIDSIHGLPSRQLALLPQILAREGLSERAYKKTASVLKLIVEAAPEHQVLMLLALQHQIHGLKDSACSLLNQISSQGIERSSIYSLGGIGTLILRVLHSVESLTQLGSEDENEGAVDSMKMITSALNVLWEKLSPLVSEIESQIRSPGNPLATGTEADVSSKVLPSGASQTLPFVESFFVLCSAQKSITKDSNIEEDPITNRQSSSEFSVGGSLGGSTSLDLLASPGPSAKDAVLQDFVERHRLLLNAFIRQTPGLLEGSFKPLIQTPRLIDFDNKRLYFRSKVRSDDRQHYGTLRINVRREHVFEDSFYQLRHRSSDELRWKLSVQFAGEEGIDAGGVAREWYQVMSKEIFNPNLALFIAVPDGASTFQPNPNSIIQNDRGVNHLDFFRFVGRLVGKALYDGQLVDAHFTRSFYKHMLNQPLTYQDLEAVDLDFYRQMKWILENDITDVLMGQTFSAEVDFFGRKQLVELKESGAKISVTEANKKEYVNLMTKHKMTTAIRDQIKAFQEGFWELIPMDLITIFNDHELELIISGLPEVDIADLKAHTDYTGYTAASTVIQWFWSIVEELDKENLALLLQFVTGTSKIPLEGFAHLQGISGPQKFQIHKSYVTTNRLPSAHTCFNQLDLPEYESREQLKERLLLAIHEGREGFGFG